MLISGIYAITHRASGRVYIGSSSRVQRRLKEHRWKLRNGRHHSPKLQAAWDKYGDDAFEFCVLEHVSDIDDLLAREQDWIERSGAAIAGFNICPVAGRTAGRRASPETRAKMKAARAFVSEETRARRSASTKGQPKSAEHRAKIAAGQRGKRASPEARARMRAAALARSPAVAAKIAASRPKLVHTEEAKERIAEGVRIARARQRNRQSVSVLQSRDE